MRWCRIRLVLLGLLLCVVHVFSGTCGQRFTDPASSAVLANVVIEGKVRKISEPDSAGTYNISVAVKKNIFKGGNLINKGRPVKTVTIDRFKTGANDNKNCVASVQKGRTYLFFLKNSADPKGLYFEIMAMPVKKSKKVMTAVRKVTCENCAKAPSISELSGVEKMATETNITFTCVGEGNPPPEFSWYKDDVLVDRHNARYRVTNRKRESTLEINMSRVKDSGNYECVAVNVLGEVRRNITIDVISAKQMETCEIQTLCLNGGTCMHSYELSITFCSCTNRFEGSRCEKEQLDPARIMEVGQATLMLERTLIIVGIVIAVLVFVVICIASYILAKQGRKRFKQRCNCVAKQAKDNSADYRTADSRTADYRTADSRTADYNTADPRTANDNRTDPRTADYNTTDHNTADCNRTDCNRSDYSQPDYSRSDYSRSEYNRPVYSQPAVCVGGRHVPQGTAFKAESEMIHGIIPSNQAQKLPQTILLQDCSSPPVNQSTPGRLKDFSLQLHHPDVKIVPSEGRPEPRGRLAASSVINMELPSFTAPGDGKRSNTSSASPVSEHIEMRALSEATNEGASKRDTHIPSERLTNGSRPSLFGEKHLPSPQRSPEQSSSLSLSPQTNLSGTSPLLLGYSTPPSQTLPPSLNSPSQDQPQLFHENSFLLSENDTSVQPLLQHQKNDSHKHQHINSHRLFESSSDKDIARYLPLSNNMQGIHAPSGYKNDIEDNQLLLRKLSKLSHSNTFPKSKENGLQSDAFSDSDEEEASEVPYKKQLDLFISEEDLGLSKENLEASSSFSSVNTPSRQSSQEERGFRRVLNSGGSRPGIRKHQSEEGSVYKLINKSHAYLQDSTRSRSLDNPQVKMDAPPQPQRLNSTVAGSPDVETYDNMSQKPLHLHNHLYSYDPNEDSSPWEGEMNRTGHHSSTTGEERDRSIRLKDVVPDQQAIPI